jgi:hypothetical protein
MRSASAETGTLLGMTQTPPTGELKQSQVVGTNPVAKYMLFGVRAAAIFLLCSGAVVLATYLSAKSSGDLSGAGGVIGFMIVPFVALAGAPWSLLLIRSDSSVLAIAGVIVGPLINGAIIGAFRGYIAGRRANRDQA